MKKILAMAIAVLMIAALCVNTTATFQVDRIYVNANSLWEGEDVKDYDPIHIERGDKLYTLGWAANPDAALKEVVYKINGGEERPCSDKYRDRADVAGAGIPVADFGAHAGIGFDDDMMELIGIDELKDGTYELTLTAKYEDGSVEEKYYTLEVGTGVEAGTVCSLDALKRSGSNDNYAYSNEIVIQPGEKVYALGWVYFEYGAPLEKIVYKVDRENDLECSDVYRDRPDVASVFGDEVPDGGRNAGFGTDAELIELVGIGDLPEGCYEVILRGVFEDGTEADFRAFTLYVGEKKRPLETVEEGMLNIVIDGGTDYVYAFRGDTVDVKIELVNNTGICSLRADVYWSQYLHLVDAKYDIYNENKHTQLINEPDEYDYWEGVQWSDLDDFVFNWVDGNGKTEGDVTYVTLTFEVSEDAANDAFLWVEAYVDGSDVFADLNEYLEYTVINGGVDVLPDRGDVDGDYRISNRDVIALFRHVSGIPAQLHVLSGDVNADGVVNNKDVVELFRMSSSFSRDW